MAREVRLTDNVLLGLARMQAVRSKIPAFGELYASLGKRGCGKCRKTSTYRQRDVLSAIKKLIVTDGGVARTIKALTSADTIIVYVQEGPRLVKRIL